MDCHLFSRRQPSSMVTGTTQGGSNLLNLAFGYGTSNNNGNVLSQTIVMPKLTSGTLTVQQTYGYDGVNRLASAGETVTAGGSGGGAWSFNHGYDQFGNMWVSNSTGLTAHAATPRAGDQFGATTNRLTKAFDGSTLSNPYDVAGNLINHPYVGAMQYDAENRQKQFTSGSTTATYHYDGDGRRVKRVLGEQTTVYVYDAFGMLAAEYSTATPTETGGRRYRTTDHLGSTRLVTDDSGAVKTRHDYVPFGEELPASSSAGNRNLVFGFGVSPSERHKFTGKERDAESNLDYFIARYYSSPMGRFTSADPENAGAIGVDPQSWNGYSYVRNQPTILVDPDGRVFNLGVGLIGGAVGGLVNAGLQLAFTGDIEGKQVLAASGAGFAAGATLGALAPAAATTIVGITGTTVTTVSLSGTAGAAAMSVAPAAAAGIAGGITGRAIEAEGALSERLDAATSDPVAIATDAAAGVVAQGAATAAKSVAQGGRVAGAARDLGRQVTARTQPGAPANSAAKTNRIAQRFQQRQRQARNQQNTAGQAGTAGALLVIEDEKMREDQER